MNMYESMFEYVAAHSSECIFSLFHKLDFQSEAFHPISSNLSIGIPRTLDLASVG